MLPAPDREDAHVLETALAGRADLPVTAGMVDFSFPGIAVLEEGRVLRFRPADHDLVIGYPFRAAGSIGSRTFCLCRRGRSMRIGCRSGM